MNGKERKTVEDLRAELGTISSPFFQDDWTLVRWLRQNKFDVALTAKRLRNHFQFRAVLGLDADPENFEMNSDLARFWPFTWLGTKDRSGCPIAIRQAGRVDVRGMLKTIKTSDYVSHELRQSEKAMRELLSEQRKQNRVVGMCVILDMEGFSYDPHNLALVNSYFKGMEELIIDQNYPLIDEKIFIVNAPKFVASLCGLLHKIWPYIDRVQIFDSNFRPKLAELIDPDQLPEMYGGTVNNAIVQLPAKIEVDRYYMPERDDPSDQFHVTVKARRRVHLTCFYVPEAARLRWFFKGDHDIAFGVFYSEAAELNEDGDYASLVDGRLQMATPKHRSKTDAVAERGTLLCEAAGVYVFEFCNAHSRLSSKVVSIWLDLRTPTGLQIQWRQFELSCSGNSI